MLDALLFTKTPKLFTSLYPECLWRVDTKEKVLYLTFDDGPIPEVTPFVLDELKKYKAKATFFCIGKNVEENSAIFKRIIKEGHSIGNHTQNHMSGWGHKNKDYFANIEQCKSVLAGHGAPASNLFRPPYGRLTPSQYKNLKLKYRIVMWDVISFDFDLKTRRSSVLKRVLKYGEPGSIIVFHDSLKAKKRMEFALPKVLAHFSAKGFKFEKL